MKVFFFIGNNNYELCNNIKFGYSWEKINNHGKYKNNFYTQFCSWTQYDHFVSPSLNCEVFESDKRTGNGGIEKFFGKGPWREFNNAIIESMYPKKKDGFLP